MALSFATNLPKACVVSIDVTHSTWILSLRMPFFNRKPVIFDPVVYSDSVSAIQLLTTLSLKITLLSIAPLEFHRIWSHLWLN